MVRFLMHYMIVLGIFSYSESKKIIKNQGVKGEAMMNLDQNSPADGSKNPLELPAPDMNLQLPPTFDAVILTKPENANFTIDREALKKIKLVAVAYSNIEREWFPTKKLTMPSMEVEKRALEVIAELEKLGIPAKGYPGDAYFMTKPAGG